MSRPFSADCADARKLKDVPQEHRYAVAYVVLFYTKHGFFEFVDYGVSIETALHEGRAIEKVWQPLTKKYRECNGYICRVKAEEIID